jgi:hypothetical protein
MELKNLNAKNAKLFAKVRKGVLLGFNDAVVGVFTNNCNTPTTLVRPRVS